MKAGFKVMGNVLFIAALNAGGVVAAATFEQLDVNNDGQLSITEAGVGTRLTTMWSTADVDQDGVVNRAEFSTFERLQKRAEDHDASPGHKPGGTTHSDPGADSR